MRARTITSVGWDQRASGECRPTVIDNTEILVGRRSLRDLVPPYDDSQSAVGGAL